jgi:hypothetical protein
MTNQQAVELTEPCVGSFRDPHPQQAKYLP